MNTAAAPVLSVVIPLGPGERAQLGLLPQLGALPADSEIVLVGAEGDSPPCPPGIDATRLRAPPGRARQLNAGCRAARGRWLWLLHADSRLLPGTLDALERFLAEDQDALGYFDLRFANDGPALVRLNQWGAFLRSRWLGLPFGDQGFIIRRERLAALGGFDERAEFGEDHLLVWRARQTGLPLRPLRAPIQTSARKYAERGWLATTLGHLKATWQQACRAQRR